MRGISQIERDFTLPKTPFKGRVPVVIDSGEQFPFSFSQDRFVEIVRPLAAGDYSIAGLEGDFAVERKSSIDELVSWFTAGRARFYHEIALLSKIPAAMIVVETGGVGEIIKHDYKSDMNPQSAIGTIISIIQRFRVPIFFAESRLNARLFVEQSMLYHCAKIFDKYNKIKGLNKDEQNSILPKIK